MLAASAGEFSDRGPFRNRLLGSLGERRSCTTGGPVARGVMVAGFIRVALALAAKGDPFPFVASRKGQVTARLGFTK